MNIRFYASTIGFLVLVIGYQNCSHVPQDQLNQNSHRKGMILNSRTITYSITFDPTSYTIEDFKIQGKYTYPAISKEKISTVAIEKLNTFFTCTNEPKTCDITIQIPPDIPEMDLSRIYSESAILSISMRSPQSLENRLYSLYLDRTSIQEPIAEKDFK